MKKNTYNETYTVLALSPGINPKCICIPYKHKLDSLGIVLDNYGYSIE